MPRWSVRSCRTRFGWRFKLHFFSRFEQRTSRALQPETELKRHATREFGTKIKEKGIIGGNQAFLPRWIFQLVFTNDVLQILCTKMPSLQGLGLEERVLGDNSSGNRVHFRTRTQSNEKQVRKKEGNSECNPQRFLKKLGHNLEGVVQGNKTNSRLRDN